MTDEEFEQLVRESLTTLPQKFKDVLENVEVVIEDEPSEEQQREMHLRSSMSLFGLYQGIPLTKRRNYTNVLPDKITIFKLPIENASPDEYAVKEQVRRTVLHEIGHYFGMSDMELRKLKY